MALATAAASPGSLAAFGERRVESRRRKWRIHLQISCRKRDREQHQHERHPYKVVEITPPPTDLGVRCFPSNMQCGESVTIEGQAYTISAVTHRYQLRHGRYKPSEKRLDVQSTGRYILNLYLENLLQKS
ncbi:unnamed protein product [Spirodela intermedia]|uniref:Uncharacterized protein n=1 Tax=Spirodela intermedia TaxID=51605 RepID=A0A7I8LIL5_SPIIN|nr:unnamed protein product [Spirodela intermedia]